MSCTVLGASGFIGSHLAARLRANCGECFTPARGDPAIFQRDLGHVYYCIGLTADFRRKPFETVRAHVCVLADVLEKARFSSLLYLSSTRLYAGSADTSEEADIKSGDLYNASKATGEALCLASGGENVRIVRLSNVFGNDPGSENFLPSLVGTAVRDGAIRLETTLDSEKDYVGIEEVVGVLPRIAAGGRHRLYNVASGVNVSNAKIVQHIQQASGCRVEVAPHATRVSFAPIDTGRLRQEFGFAAGPLLDGLDRLIGQARGATSTG